MKMEFCGPAYVVGDNVDTDIIYPGRYLDLTDPDEIGRHCMAGLKEDYSTSFRPGGILVAGKNFGCGSSREHAAIALRQMQVSCVLADSFARIFFRNGINLGLPLIICPGASHRVKEGQHLRVDLEQRTVRVEETGETLSCEALQEAALRILDAGGIKPLMRAKYGGR